MSRGSIERFRNGGSAATTLAAASVPSKRVTPRLNVPSALCETWTRRLLPHAPAFAACTLSRSICATPARAWLRIVTRAAAGVPLATRTTYAFVPPFVKNWSIA